VVEALIVMTPSNISVPCSCISTQNFSNHIPRKAFLYYYNDNIYNNSNTTNNNNVFICPSVYSMSFFVCAMGLVPEIKLDLYEKSAQRDANTARAGCSKVRTPPARLLQTRKHAERTDNNTLIHCATKLSAQCK